jgi:hypothetical protein
MRSDEAIKKRGLSSQKHWKRARNEALAYSSPSLPASKSNSPPWICSPKVRSAAAAAAPQSREAYAWFVNAEDAERFAVHAMRSFIRNDMPVRMGLSYGSFTNYEFKTGVLPNGHLMFAAPFMGTAVVDSYRAESSGIKGMRILVHPSFFMSAPDLDEFLVPLPKSEQRPEAVGELNWHDIDLRLTSEAYTPLSSSPSAAAPSQC